MFKNKDAKIRICREKNTGLKSRCLDFIIFVVVSFFPCGLNQVIYFFLCVCHCSLFAKIKEWRLNVPTYIHTHTDIYA